MKIDPNSTIGKIILDIQESRDRGDFTLPSLDFVKPSGHEGPHVGVVRSSVLGDDWTSEAHVVQADEVSEGPHMSSTPLVPEVLRKHRKSRMWLYAPSLHWHGLSTLLPICFGHDEFSRRTVMIGWTITGRLVIATRYCGDEDCYEQSVRWIEYDDED